MSKGLKALEEIEKCMVQNCDYAEYYKEFDIIEKELKALDIIVKHDIDLPLLKECIELNMQLCDYNRHFKTLDGHYLLTEEEYDLLKEVLL